MKNTPALSFVIPAYNAATTLAEAVDSIFNDNFKDGDEVIIVNDASSDTTDQLAQELSKKYSPHITVINNPENKGCPASRNIGITRARNELIFNLDADNVLPRASIDALKVALIKENTDVAAFGEYYYFKKSIQKIHHRWICKPGIFTLADIFCGIVNQAPGGNYLYKKNTWERIGKYWEYGKGLHEAWGFSLKLLLGGAKFIVVPGTFYYHRYSHQSLFVRENSRTNESTLVSNKFIAPALDLLDDASRTHIATHPDWFDHINEHPLHLKSGVSGANGTIVFTSPLRNTYYKIKNLLKKK